MAVRTLLKVRNANIGQTGNQYFSVFSNRIPELLIEKGLITQAEFMVKLSEERVTYQAMLNPKAQ